MKVDDKNWLIEQAEQVHGLEEQANDMAEKHAEKDIIIEQLLAKIKRYEEVLEEINYHYPTPIDFDLNYEKAYDEIKNIAKKVSDSLGIRCYYCGKECEGLAFEQGNFSVIAHRSCAVKKVEKDGQLKK